MAQAAPVPETTADATVLRPAQQVRPGGLPGAPPGVPHAPALPQTEPRQTPAWPFVTVAAVLVVLLGVGATLAVRHFLVPEPAPIPTTSITDITPVVDPDPPQDVTIQVILEEAEGGQLGKAKVSWAVPPGATDEHFYRVRWKDMPANYEQYGAWHDVHGRESLVLAIPPGLEGRCIEVYTAAPNGARSQSVEECLEDG